MLYLLLYETMLYLLYETMLYLLYETMFTYFIKTCSTHFLSHALLTLSNHLQVQSEKRRLELELAEVAEARHHQIMEAKAIEAELTSLM